MYRALYRKYRPRFFRDVYGQEAVTSALQNQLRSGKVGHAYLFTGMHGTGKTTCAKLFARAVNCLDPKDGEPCGGCAVCRGLDDGTNLDVIEMDAASNTSIDDIRELRDVASYTPANSKYKVYIIDEVHMLSKSAFNGLLKTIEEPPAHVIFILATTEIQKVPETIISRCQRFDFHRIPLQTIKTRLLSISGMEKIELTEGAAQLIAQAADGAMRDALSILDTCAGSDNCITEELVRRLTGLADRSYLFDLSESIEKGDCAGVLAVVSQLCSQSIDARRLCEEIISHYRSLLLAGIGTRAVTDDMESGLAQRYLTAAKSISLAEEVRAIRRFGDCLDRMSRGTDPRIEFELAAVELCGMPAAAAPKTEAAAKTVPSGGSTKTLSAPAETKTAEQPDREKSTPGPEDTGAADAVPCEFWPKVIELAGENDLLLHSFLQSSTAWLQGGRVLIDGSELFLNYMRTHKDSNLRLRTLIEKASGEKYSIGPWKPETEKKAEPRTTAEETLRQLSDQGVIIDYQ